MVAGSFLGLVQGIFSLCPLTGAIFSFAKSGFSGTPRSSGGFQAHRGGAQSTRLRALESATNWMKTCSVSWERLAVDLRCLEQMDFSCFFFVKGSKQGSNLDGLKEVA